MNKLILIFLLLATIVIVSGCSSGALIEIMEEQYGAEIESSRVTRTDTTHRSTFKVCTNEVRTNCKPKDYDNFDNLDTVSIRKMTTLVKLPDKSYFISESTNPNEGGTVRKQLTLCENGASISWDSDYPNVLTKEEEAEVCRRLPNQLATQRILENVQEVADLKNRLTSGVRRTTLDGRNVIELYFKEKPGFSRTGRIEQESQYFDAETFVPIKNVETNFQDPFDLLIDGKLVTHIELSKIVRVFEDYGINDVADSEFILPEELQDLKVCSYTPGEQSNAIERFDSRQSQMRGVTSGRFTEEQFNELESLYVSVPSKRCRGIEERPYEDYASTNEWGYSFP